jgi:hypothetical protein
VIRWIVIVPAEMRPGAAEDLELLKAVNELNTEPGCKFRVLSDTVGDHLVCEVDLPADLVTTAWLQRAYEISRDSVDLHLEELKDVCC